jgi:hypothetical protein
MRVINIFCDKRHYLVATVRLREEREAVFAAAACCFFVALAFVAAAVEEPFDPGAAERLALAARRRLPVA